MEALQSSAGPGEAEKDGAGCRPVRLRNGLEDGPSTVSAHGSTATESWMPAAQSPPRSFHEKTFSSGRTFHPEGRFGTLLAKTLGPGVPGPPAEWVRQIPTTTVFERSRAHTRAPQQF